MDFELILGRSIRDQFLDGMPDQEIEVLDVEHMKVEDYFNVLVSNRHVLQSPICFQDFSKGSLEGFIGLNQWLISQMAKCAFARDDVSADSGTIERVYLGSLYGAREG